MARAGRAAPAAEHQNRGRNHNSTMRDEEIDGRIGGPRGPQVRREQRHARSRQPGKIRKLDHDRDRLNARPNRAPHCQVAKLKRQIRQVDALMRVAERPPDQFVRRQREADRRARAGNRNPAAPGEPRQQRRRRGDPRQPREMNRSEQGQRASTFGSCTRAVYQTRRAGSASASARNGRRRVQRLVVLVMQLFLDVRPELLHHIGKRVRCARDQQPLHVVVPVARVRIVGVGNRNG